MMGIKNEAELLRAELRNSDFVRGPIKKYVGYLFKRWRIWTTIISEDNTVGGLTLKYIKHFQCFNPGDLSVRDSSFN